MITNDFKIGERVIYIPSHAFGDRSHEDCEHGTVSSVNDLYVFVKYYDKQGAQSGGGVATLPGDLIKSNRVWK